MSNFFSSEFPKATSKIKSLPHEIKSVVTGKKQLIVVLFAILMILSLVGLVLQLVLLRLSYGYILTFQFYSNLLVLIISTLTVFLKSRHARLMQISRIIATTTSTILFVTYWGFSWSAFKNTLEAFPTEHIVVVIFVNLIVPLLMITFFLITTIRSKTIPRIKHWHALLSSFTFCFVFSGIGVFGLILPSSILGSHLFSIIDGNELFTLTDLYLIALVLIPTLGIIVSAIYTLINNFLIYKRKFSPKLNKQNSKI